MKGSKVVAELKTYVKNNDSGEITAINSFLTDEELECLCLFRNISSKDQMLILGRMHALVLKNFKP